MSNPWDLNASRRHAQITSGIDVSMRHVLAPALLAEIRRATTSTGTRVLDVGCGTGYLTKLLGDLGYDVVGIDPSVESLRIAAEYVGNAPNVRLCLTDLVGFSSASGADNDVVVANMTLQAIDPLADAIQAISRLVKNGGVFVFSIPHPLFFLRTRVSVDGNHSYHVSSEHHIPFVLSRDQEPLPGRVPYHHRPLSAYFAALESAGFLTRRLLEPFPDDSTMTLYPTPWDSPKFIVVTAAKLTSQ